MGEDADDLVGSSVALGGDANDDGYDVASADVTLTGESADGTCGSSVAWAGDLGGDGHDDLLLGCQADDSAGVDAGATYVLYGPVSASGSLSSADAALRGESGSDYSGNTVLPAGDTDADGYGDILIGAPLDDDGGTSAGAVYLLLGGGL